MTSFRSVPSRARSPRAALRLLITMLATAASRDALAMNFATGGVCYTFLSSAVSAAGPTDTILVKPGSSTTLNSAITWTGNKTLQAGTDPCMGVGPFTGTPTIHADAGKRAFVISANDSLIVDGVNLAGGNPASGLAGGTVFAGANSGFAFFDATMSGGVTTAANGGCLAAAHGSTVIIDNATIEECTADGNGGGVAVDYGSIASLIDVTLSDNTGVFGGGIFADGTDLSILGASSITGNYGLIGGGGVAVESFGAASDFDIVDETTIDFNLAGSNGGGVFIESGTNAMDADITDSVVIDSNDASDGAGIYTEETTALLDLTLADDVVVSNNTATNGGGLKCYDASVTLLDDVAFSDNVGDLNGGGMWLEGCTVAILGSHMDAQGTLGDTTGGVRFESNSTPWDAGAPPGATTGSAIHASGSTIDADQLAVEDHDGVVIRLISSSTMTANRSHFNKNDHDLPAEPTVVLFDVQDTATLEVTADFGNVGCDDALDLIVFSADRYCSEIRNNHGLLMNLEEGGTATVRTTGIMANTVKATDVGFDAMGDLTFTTDMVGFNGSQNSPAVLVAVRSGGDFQAKQNSFADPTLPVSYEAGSTGDFRRNAAFATGAGVAVTVDSLATVTGTQNIGDWSGAISSAFPNGTAPGWVTTARGSFHLNSSSAAVDICTTDGPFDIEGTARPDPYPGNWDAGAIELDQP